MLDITQRNRMPVERINSHAEEHGVAMARLKLDRPVDRSRLFTCPSLAPLTHASVFAALSPPQQLRYNQLVGLLQNEMICIFEQEVGARVLPALLRKSGQTSDGAFGALWSGMQYVHHYATERHITRGARNLWIWRPIDKLWLNHNLHRAHHEHPTVSWIHLEKFGRTEGDDRQFLPRVYLRMWSGPRKAATHVENRFAGKVIR
jgi:hypothetical protein